MIPRVHWPSSGRGPGSRFLHPAQLGGQAGHPGQGARGKDWLPSSDWSEECRLWTLDTPGRSVARSGIWHRMAWPAPAPESQPVMITNRYWDDATVTSEKSFTVLVGIESTTTYQH